MGACDDTQAVGLGAGVRCPRNVKGVEKAAQSSVLEVSPSAWDDSLACCGVEEWQHSLECRTKGSCMHTFSCDQDCILRCAVQAIS